MESETGDTDPSAEVVLLVTPPSEVSLGTASPDTNQAPSQAASVDTVRSDETETLAIGSSAAEANVTLSGEASDLVTPDEVSNLVAADEALPNPAALASISCNTDRDRELPQPKRLKRNHDYENVENLRVKLRSMMKCCNCGLLPKDQVFNCPNGHLLCKFCYDSMVFWSRQSKSLAVCTLCRTPLPASQALRNLLAEGLVADIPQKCKFCKLQTLDLRGHLRECPARLIFCSYKNFGCPWVGKVSAQARHEDEECPFPKKTGAEILDHLHTLQNDSERRRIRCCQLLAGLRSDQIHLVDLLMKPKDDTGQELCYESFPFKVAELEWQLTLRLEQESLDGAMSFWQQLKLVSEPTGDWNVRFIVLDNDMSNVVVIGTCSDYLFNATHKESEEEKLRIAFEDTSAFEDPKCMRLRIAMFINHKEQTPPIHP